MTSLIAKINLDNDQRQQIVICQTLETDVLPGAQVIGADWAERSGNVSADVILESKRLIFILQQLMIK